ncbi:hypothetical protein F5Y16DRAFT_303201 [Xylariaceae sp. FL0255]|nr:hypothetical protein F5Y16DRAFT_303201 [Xylariaceae sp. FL0255]
MRGHKFVRQTLALTKKNLIIAIKRKWISTLLRALILPILFLVLLLEIQNFVKDTNTYGIGSIHAIKTLSDSLGESGKPLVTIQDPGLGKDFAPFFERFKQTIGSHSLIQLDDESQLNTTCPVDFHGQSPCHAAVIFTDSPQSGAVNASWKYNIRRNPASDSIGFSVYNTDSGVESIILPLQAAIDNSIANLTSPEIQAYTGETQEIHEKDQREEFQILALYILSFVFFLSMVPVAHHVSSMICLERENGMSALIDAMGSDAAWSRVFAYVLTMDLLYLPLWIILGAVFWNLLLPTQNAGIVIFWQILTGWSITSASVFGAAFFRNHSFGSLFVALIPLLLAVLAAYSENLLIPPPLSQVIVLSLLFPSMNYIYFFSVVTKAEIAGIRLDLGSALSNDVLTSLGLGDISGENSDVPNWVSLSGSYFLWVILFVQIIGFPLFAVLVESRFYGNNRRRRQFYSSSEALDSQAAIQTTGLTKRYMPSWSRRIFCCARAPNVKAVDGLDLTIFRRAIFCILGPNGSGKTSTLDLLAGFQAPTGGEIAINAPTDSIGVTPQKNVLWDQLTVYEHLRIWSAVKGDAETPESLDKLIERCDLVKKKNSLAGSLSGGMKRKLQLACMLVGGSSVCFADEVTSGLDPLSRRTIWNVILGERARRTIILTTHFLDEAEVLADRIAIVTLGKLKCEGTPAELKNKYGGGYRVHIPKVGDVSSINHPLTERPDRYICTTPDSSSAAAVIASLKTSKNSELYITGPTIEDVFLKVAEDPHTLARETEEISSGDSLASRSKDVEPTPSVTKIYLMQMRALFLKRIILLKSTWWMYIAALAIPILVAHFIGPFLHKYMQPECGQLVQAFSYDEMVEPFFLEAFAVGPPSANASVTKIVNKYGVEANYFAEEGIFVEPTRNTLQNFIQTQTTNLSYGGAMWAGNDSLIAYDASFWQTAPTVLNLVNQVRSGVAINATLSLLSQYQPPTGGDSVFWITIFCLVQALYPAFFSLYVTYERRSKVRALMYSNGIRPLPTLLSYLLFDFIFVIVISIACTALIAPQAPWFHLGYMFLIQAFYGLAATLFTYLVSFMSRSQPSAFALSVLFMALMYVVSLIAFLVPNQYNTPNLQVALDGTTYGLGLIFPIQNLLRGFAISLNTHIVRCRGSTTVTDPGSIYAYGGPILLLIIQNIGLFLLVLWLEGGNLNLFSKPKAISEDAEKSSLQSGRPDVDAETTRVMTSQSDLVRVQHVSKSFGTFSAVDDVSFGLEQGEILALLGPNGAGKTTTVNLIRGEMTPSSGRIYLNDVDVHKNTRLAQQNLGVCPQFDAIDKDLTVKEHLAFYARAKGVPNMKQDIAQTLSIVGLTAHANKAASKLSGGNKRKLSLAIALVGNPPVLILDEPSSAMDAVSKRVLWKTLQAVAPGRSVLITTHSMEEADALATRAAIIARRLLAIGSTEQLRKTHSNEYHVDLILDSAPLSAPDEMEGIAKWAQTMFTGVRFEGEHLNGQVKFVVPANSQVPSRMLTSTDGTADDISDVRVSRSFTRYLIETLEENKARLGLECYSISAATMESVFLRVVKESDAEEDQRVEKRPWWRL